jgi:hypothetical protein
MLQKPINRRTLLKALLAAGGGLTASAFLPAQWTKPLVKTGVLPAHAQTSARYYLTAGYGEWTDDEPNAGTVTGIWAFVSSTPPDKSPARNPGQGKSPSPVLTAPINGVGNISVTLSHRDEFPATEPTIWPTLPSTLRTGTSGRDLGFVRFADQEYTWTSETYSAWLTFTSAQCINSPVEEY